MICNGSLVEYYDPNFGRMCFPLQSPTLPDTDGADQQLNHTQAAPDINKHPLWLAELMALRIHDDNPHIPVAEWNPWSHNVFALILLPIFDSYCFSNEAWDILVSFFDFTLQPDSRERVQQT